jgi:hypothetical protein
MIIYEVTAIIEARLAEVYERFMRRQHIPDVLATDCFQQAELSGATPGRYRIRYEVSTAEDLERYLATHAPRLREDFASRFPEGAVLTREVWTVIQRWDAPPPSA